MPMLKFLPMTLIGAFIWNMLLAWAGYKLKENWEELRGYFHWIDRVIAVMILAVVVAFIWRQIVEWKAQKRQRLDAMENDSE